MDKTFDYEKIFMSVSLDRSKGYQKRVWKEDYRLGRLTEAIPPQKGKLLDIGCGGGALTECLPYYYPQMKISGCDVSRTAISYARKNGSGNVKYALIKNQKLPYNDNFFDVCICLDVLEHIQDINYFLKELKRVLKKNGLFYLAVACERQPFTITWIFQKIKIGQNLTFKHVGHIHPEFTHEYIIELLHHNKFSILNKTYGDHFFYQIESLFAYLLAKEFLEFLLGPQKAEQYYDRTLLVQKKKNDKIDIFLYLRAIWIKLWGLGHIVMCSERKFMKNVSFGSWKLFVLSRNIK